LPFTGLTIIDLIEKYGIINKGLKIAIC